MASGRLSDARFILRPSYSSLSDSGLRESFDGRFRTGRPGPRIVDSVSCRQMYLRSYTFSRKESVGEKTKKYVRGVVKKASGMRLGLRMTRVKAKDEEVPCSPLFSVVRRILSCSARIDVADNDGRR